MNQHEPENNLTNLDVYETFLGGLLACYVRSFKVISALGCRNIGKLLNGQNVHFRFKSYRKKPNEHKDFLLFILNINKIHTHKT